MVRQRRAAERKQEGNGAAPAAPAAQPAIGATEMTMPGSTGIAFKTDYEKFGKSGLRHDGMPHPHGHPGGDPERHERDDQGLPGRNRRLLPFLRRRSLPLRIPARDRRRSAASSRSPRSGTTAAVFADLRDTDKLEGKCGCCEFRNVCMGCRARAYAATGNYMAEEPFCVYQPKALATKE